MSKKEELKKIAEEIAYCEICQSDSLGKPVPGEGNPDTKVIFIGEAPGKQEAETGRPFIGRSGKLLRESIRAIGLIEEDVFITSVCKYLPITGKPTTHQIEHGRIHLQEQIAVIKPKVLVLLGSVACQGVLQFSLSVAKEHGTFVMKNGMKCFISYHPAAAIRFTKILRYFEEDFQLLKEIITAV